MTLHRNQPLDWYLNAPHVTHSKLRTFDEGGPALYHARHVEKTLPREETDALRFGTAFEALFQRGGHGFEAECQLIPAGHGNLGTVKAAKAAAAAKGKVPISQDDYTTMLEMARSLRELPEIGKAEVCEQQVTLVGESCGLTMQSRPDYVMLSDLHAYSVDLKTTKNLSDLLSGHGIVKLGYHTQAALVRRLMRQHGYDPECYLLAVEKIPVYRSALIHLPSEMLDAGDRWIDLVASRIKHCMDTDQWARAMPGIVEIETPRWLRASEDAA